MTVTVTTTFLVLCLASLSSTLSLTVGGFGYVCLLHFFSQKQSLYLKNKTLKFMFIGMCWLYIHSIIDLACHFYTVKNKKV